MRVIEIGTFLLPVRLSLTNLMAGTGLPAPGRDLVDAALRAEFAEFSAPPTIEARASSSTSIALLGPARWRRCCSRARWRCPGWARFGCI